MHKTRHASIGKYRWLATLLLLPLLSQCHEGSVTAPDIPQDIQATAIRLRVDVGAGTVGTIGAPADSRLSFSLVGSDAVALQTSNMTQTALSGNKLLVRFDVAITNSLSNVTLIKPTTPTPPAGTTGVLLFPFQSNVTSGSGTVTPSTDWDGAPYAFFDDARCSTKPTRDCLRWEDYQSSLAPGATSSARTVGFEIDKSVQSFDVVMLVAADLQNVQPTADPNAIYVSESDPTAIDDSQCGRGPTGTGTGNHPCKSIGVGLSRAVAFARSDVLVADGHYTEAVTLVNGKNLLGGYAPDSWQRHVATTNTIIDGYSTAPSTTHDRTVIANGITSATVFEGFVVRGSANNKIGGNSYAIYVSGSSGLAIRHNVIYGGTGGPGAQGSPGSSGANGGNGVGRDSNPAAYDAHIASGTGQCNISNDRNPTNGAPGTGAGGYNISGGNGGGTNCPTSSTLTQQSASNGYDGQPGGGAGGGTVGVGGSGGFDFRLESSGASCIIPPSPGDGANGTAGGNGQPADAASGATDADGSVPSSDWVAATGGSGATGSNGAGGGGGGAGGGAYSQSSLENKDRLGGVGGGGGAGGSAGGGGGAGSGGGGAFGIFVVGPAPEVTDNSIIRGTGGNGGNGGNGAAGGAGGQGGAGGLAAVFCTGAGGHGGNGGAGGAGAGGGGAAGGGSFAIYTQGAGSPNYCLSGSNSVSGGTGGVGGQGGQSVGNPGGNGVSGTVAACSFH